MKVQRAIQSLVSAAVSLLMGSAIALAHGGPGLTLKQDSVSPGGKVVISVDGMGEHGGMVKIMLTGANYQKQIGMVSLMNTDMFENRSFTIPKDAQPGTYQLKAINGSRVAQQQIEIVAGSGSSSGMSGMAEPAQSPISVHRTTTEWVVSIALIVLTVGVALVLLWRSRSELIMVS